MEDKIELLEWQHDLMVTVLTEETGYTVVNVPRGAGKSTIAAFLTHYDATVFVANERNKGMLLRYDAVEAQVHVFDRLHLVGLEPDGAVIFDDIKPPAEWVNAMKDNHVIYLRSPPTHVDVESVAIAEGANECPCGNDICATLHATKLKQLTVEQDFSWDEETKILTYGEQKFSWMPEWKLPDWATGRVFYFSTLGSPEALNKTRFDEAQKNRVAGSLVGAPLNQNHKRYDLVGQNIIIDTEVSGERLEGVCYVEDKALLDAYDNELVVGCSIDYKDRNYDKTSDYDVEGAFGLGLAWVTKPFVCGFPDSLVHEATEVPEDMGIETKTMTDSVMDFVDKELLKNRTIVFTGYVGDFTCERAMKLLEYLGSVSDEPIKVILNSGGGSVFSGLLVFDTIKQLTDRGIEVTCEARGIAASMGAIIIQAGTHRVATPNTRFLIHEVSSWSWGKTSEMEEELIEVKKVNNMMKSIIADRTGKTIEEIEAVWHKKDVWFSAEEAKEFGLIDEIIEGTKIQTQDELTTLEAHFSWLNSIELRLDGMRSLSASEVFKRLEKEEEEDDDDDDDDDDDKKKLTVDGGGGTGVAADLLASKNTIEPELLDNYFAFIEDGDVEGLRHLQFRTEDGYDGALLLAAMEDLQQMIFNGEISKSAAEAAKFQLIEGFNTLHLKIPEWATRPDGEVQSDRLSPKTRARLRRSWKDRADFTSRFHKDRVLRRLGVDLGLATDVPTNNEDKKRSD